jgi:hypothetical protein
MRFKFDNKILKLTELNQTCSACPSQWEGKVEDGKMIYVRYRWGNLEICISSKPTDDVMDAVMENYLLYETIGGEFDGSMTFEELKPYLEKFFDLTELE